ncbi:TolC-like protein [Leptospira ryugenii]|uniref:TolC-like protein n=1 Tax=Leptospira ryugenii TaxID=1917863 RepID=A0A2P2DVW8_9LEPT|nr:TolC family protein [Leptospira ryugenii]GBF48774.1 TolC-like protein [Leptospira ryugenii]
MEQRSIIAMVAMVLSSLSLLAAESDKLFTLTLKDAVKYTIENNREVMRARLELAKADSDLLKFEGRYSYRAFAEAELDQKRFPFNQNNIFSGTKTQTTTYTAGIDRLFTTGTYFKLEAKSTRFDSNAFENAATTPSGFTSLGIPPLYTDTLQVTIAQDLWKNSFGSKERNMEKMIENQSEILKDQLEVQVAEKVVGSLVDYWNYAVKESSYQTFEQLLKNTKTIRDLTVRKQGLGLSESFEVNQWNALLAQVEGQMAQASAEREEAKRKLIRSLNLSETAQFGTSSPLSEELPKNLNYDEDIAYAFKNRADFKAIQRKKENAELAMKNAKQDAMPSLKAAGTYGYQAQNLEGPSSNYTNSRNGVFSYSYPVMQGSLDLSYPIADKGVKAGLRDAEIQKRQVKLEEEDLTKSVADDVRTRIDILKASFKIMENAKKTEEESRKYYAGVVRSFQQGRFNALTVKNALDTLVQDQLSLVRAKVDYNINLHRYYVAKNALFEEYGIDRNQLLPDNL